MRPKLLRHAAVAALLLGCASTSSLSVEYALDPRVHPEGIDCFYSCLKHVEENERRWCFTFCDGVEVTATYEPCAPDSPTLCRGYPIRESSLMEAELRAQAAEAARDDDDEDDDDDDDDDDDEGDGSFIGEIFGRILVGVIEAAVCGDCDDEDDDDDDDAPRAHPDERRRRAVKESSSQPSPHVQRAPAPSSDRRGRPVK